jgi:mRNA-degrading endonuclease RelE of RelBE toxin-antitoxin system
MRLEATQTFIRLYKKLPDDIQERAKKSLELFVSNSSHPSLGHKKMSGQKDIYEIRVTDNYRMTYQKVGGIAYLRKIGSHDLLRNP